MRIEDRLLKRSIKFRKILIRLAGVGHTQFRKPQAPAEAVYPIQHKIKIKKQLKIIELSGLKDPYIWIGER